MKQFYISRSARCRWSIVGTALALCAFLAASSATLYSASVEIWPSERRSNNTLFCYGGDWNSMLITIDARGLGPHKIALPDEFADEAILEVTLPPDVKILGASQEHGGEIRNELPIETVQIKDKPWQRLRIKLDNQSLNERLVKNSHFYDANIWFEAPAKLNSKASYVLTYGGKPIAKGYSNLVSAGVLDEGRPMPRRFGFYPYGSYFKVPNNDFDRMARFYRRLGISGISSNWHRGRVQDGEEPTLYHRTFQANRDHGVKNIANMTLFLSKYAKGFHASSEGTMKRGGLVSLMDGLTKSLLTEEARAEWKSAHSNFDMVFIDWEPSGPSQWPGYEDKATIAAYAKEHHLEGKLTPEILQKEHRESYKRFRMKQIARPLYAIKEMVNSVKPMPFRVEQGSGSTAHIDYDIYGRDFDALTPMIYESPVNYARNLLRTLEHTPVPADKFWPDLTIGWRHANVLRELPQEFFLDTIVTAAAGCGSVSHWPGIYLTDAVWFGIHEGLAQIALVEDFYLDGTPVDDSGAEGLPYTQKKITLGNREIDLSKPDWKTSLFTFAHELGEERLITILNYNRSEDAYVQIRHPESSGKYLVDPATSVYQQLDDAGEALVCVKAYGAGTWIVTSDKERIAGRERILADSVESDFQAARDQFVADARDAELALGTVGDITIKYDTIDFGGTEQIALMVNTPGQTIAFGSSGGRVYDWKVKGMSDFVARDTFGSDGVGMDLLWLPQGGRWSGNEAEEMDLVAAMNDGETATIIYEGNLTKAYPGVRLRKEYRVKGTGTSLSTRVILHNGLVDETPISLSYWAHHVLKATRAHFIGKDYIQETEASPITVFPSENLPKELASKVIMPEKIVAPTGPVYAEYFPDDHTGLIFHLPDNFMNVHRWSSRRQDKHSSEWMSRPLSIPAGTSVTLSYSITAVPDATIESLQKRLLEPRSTDGDDSIANMLSHGFDKPDRNGVPVGWDFRTSGKHPDTPVVECQKDESGANVVALRMPMEATGELELQKPLSLNPQEDYLFVVQIKVEDMHYIGHWYKRPTGLRILVYGRNNQHTWLAIHGKGSTDGWMTGILPFPPKTKDRSDFASIRVLLKCFNMEGTVSFREPMIIKRPPHFEQNRFFEKENGERLMGSHLQLTHN